MYKNQPILQGYVKYRDGKKWKRRYCALKQSNRSSGDIQLFILKDYDDFRAFQSPTSPGPLNSTSSSAGSTGWYSYGNGNSPSSSLAQPLDHVYGFESGRHIDRESYVIALIGRQAVHCVGHSNVDEMFRWAGMLEQVLLDTHFHVTLTQSGEGSRLHGGLQGSLHVQRSRICLIGEPSSGNKFICSWEFSDIESYSVQEGCFCLTALRSAGKVRGRHVFEVDGGRLADLMVAMETAQDAERQLTNGDADSRTSPGPEGSTPGSTGGELAELIHDGVGRSEEISIPRSRQNSSPDRQRKLPSGPGPCYVPPPAPEDSQLIFYADEDIQDGRFPSESPPASSSGASSCSPLSSGNAQSPPATSCAASSVPPRVPNYVSSRQRSSSLAPGTPVVSMTRSMASRSGGSLRSASAEDSGIFRRSHSLNIQAQMNSAPSEKRGLLQKLFHRARSWSQDDLGNTGKHKSVEMKSDSRGANDEVFLTASVTSPGRLTTPRRRGSEGDSGLPDEGSGNLDEVHPASVSSVDTPLSPIKEGQVAPGDGNQPIRSQASLDLGFSLPRSTPTRRIRSVSNTCPLPYGSNTIGISPSSGRSGVFNLTPSLSRRMEHLTCEENSCQAPLKINTMGLGERCCQSRSRCSWSAGVAEDMARCGDPIDEGMGGRVTGDNSTGRSPSQRARKVSNPGSATGLRIGPRRYLERRSSVATSAPTEDPPLTMTSSLHSGLSQQRPQHAYWNLSLPRDRSHSYNTSSSSHSYVNVSPSVTLRHTPQGTGYMNIGPNMASDPDMPAEVVNPYMNYAMLDLRPSSIALSALDQSLTRSSVMDGTSRPGNEEEPLLSPPPTPVTLNYVHVIPGGSPSCSTVIGAGSPPVVSSSCSVNYAHIDFDRTKALSELNGDLENMSELANQCAASTSSKPSRTASVRKSLTRSIRSIGRKKSESSLS